MKITCPACESPVPANQLNIATDVGFCPRCEEAFAVSERVAGGDCAEGFDLHAGPPGTWFEERVDGWTLGASTQSWAAVFLVPFMCIWSGGSLGGIYGTQIFSGKFDLGLSLFGIPFVLGTLFLGSIAAMTVCGKLVVSTDGSEGRVFTGVGPMGWTRRFDWSTIQQVREGVSQTTDSGGTNREIALVGAGGLKFGSELSEGRRYYLLQALRRLLVDRRAAERNPRRA